MASEVPRSAGQGRTGQATKEGGRSKATWAQDKTRTTPPAKVEQRATQKAGFLTQDKRRGKNGLWPRVAHRMPWS
jgi:hypothetical protein